MSKLNQIQQKIQELNGGSFQKLADSYLVSCGYGHIVSLGSVVGNDGTRKGTPDSYFILPNGKYAFAEYTVKKSGLYEKIEEDIDKCFDFSLTNIRAEEIQEIIYCHTSQLYTNQVDGLIKKCKKKSVYLRIIGIDELSQQIYHYYPKIAKDFLGIEIDTGQILRLEDFIASYDRNSMVTPLGMKFYFREMELKEILSTLEGNDSTIISGKAGVGKSRLVIECCKKYAEKHKDTIVWCIKNNGQNIFEDLKTYFSEPGSYLVFIDDVNQTTPLTDILDYLHKGNLGINLKIIATVRDYALRRILDKFYEETHPKIIKINLLEDEQIREMARQEFNINNSLYLDRIIQIAQGNPRLAVMSAQLVVKENTLESIKDSTQLLEEYFRNIKKDLQALDDENILRIAGIVSFLNHISLKDSQNINKICTICEIEKSMFFESIQKLSNMEIIDIYEDELVKISDQILSTYLFYLVFIDKKALHYAELIEAYFPNIKQRIIETINSVYTHFNFEKVNEVINLEINIVWDSFERKNDYRLTELMLTFWFVRESETLIYIKKRINSLGSSMKEPESYVIPKNEYLIVPEGIKTLVQYRSSNNYAIAISLILEYLRKKPEDFPMIYSVLVNALGFNEDSYYQNFIIQRNIVDQVIRLTNGFENKLYTMLFLRLSNYYLGFVFDENEPWGKKNILFHRIALKNSPSLEKLREKIWLSLIELYNNEAYNKEVIAILKNFGEDYFTEVDREVIKNDMIFIKLFINEKLRENNFNHCIAADSLFEAVDKAQLETDDINIRKFYVGGYKIYKLLKGRKHLKIFNYNKEERLRELDIRVFVEDYNLEDYKSFITHCKEFGELSSSDEYELGEGMDIVFSSLMVNKSLFVEVVDFYLSQNLSISVSPKLIIKGLIEVVGLDEAERIINKYEYFNKSKWLYCYFTLIPEKEINTEYVNKLYEYFADNEDEIIGWTRNVSFLSNYMHVDSRIFINVTNIVLNKTKKSPLTVIRTLKSLFNVYSDIYKCLFEVFKDDLKVLRKAYFTLLKIDKTMNYDSNILNKLMEKDDEFKEEFICLILNSRNIDESFDFTFLWQGDNYLELVSSIVKIFKEKSIEKRYLFYDFIKQLLKLKYSDIVDISEKQDKWIRMYIEENYSSDEEMQILFYGISYFEDKRKIKLLSFLLSYNKSFELFKQLNLVSRTMTSNGSEISALEKRISLYESLLPVLRDVELLEHKKYVDDVIRNLRSKMKSMKIKELIEDN
ncbi:hypothetical protein [Clostridium sp. YIM B02551]|uniref:hypothetical protein n=1 Tax=Clostridium sp. YIM B02551 TaxID=2910679 RepID=UPI001EEA486F|nr:hypothetical protein [Clostridium sp. YIM B02551]